MSDSLMVIKIEIDIMLELVSFLVSVAKMCRDHVENSQDVRLTETRAVGSNLGWVVFHRFYWC